MRLRSTPSSVDRIELPRPDDWHVHLRDGAAVLADLVPHTARHFGRALVMPNLRPPVTTVGEAEAYRERILRAVPEGARFEPLMTLYLTPRTTVRDVEEAAASDHVHAIKLYPAGATTNSDAGVDDLTDRMPVLEAMARLQVPLCIHGESTDPRIDVFDREAVFVERTLAPLVQRLPELRIVLEHVTTEEAVAFVREAPPTVAATITPQHLRLHRNAMFEGGLRPHAYCLPVLKREKHRVALVGAATSGDPKFFLGTDSAPHERAAKESACGCAGIFNAPVALAVYAEVFDEAGALERLRGFAADHGRSFYRLPASTERVVLERAATDVPADYPLGDATVVPFRAGGRVAWSVAPAKSG